MYCQERRSDGRDKEGSRLFGGGDCGELWNGEVCEGEKETVGPSGTTHLIHHGPGLWKLTFV